MTCCFRANTIVSPSGSTIDNIDLGIFEHK